MKTVALGMSGGVDSCASAIILKEKGYEVTALYFDVLSSPDNAAFERAKEASEKLGIRIVRKDVSAAFEATVIRQFCSEYCRGRTPSPCVFCNPLIKFRTLEELGTDYIATGHYARIKKVDSKIFVSKAANIKKDQSYMLARLAPATLEHVLFPLGDVLSKDETRRLVSDAGIAFSNEKDSQDICFVNGSYKDFLSERGIVSRSGWFTDKQGNRIAEHEGISCYTIGQRKGLGVAMGMPAYVSKIEADTGNVVLTTDERDLFTDRVLIDDILLFTEITDKKYKVKLRYAAKEAECRVIPDGNKAELIFDAPQRAPAPGQAAVIYDDDIVIGSGIIYN